MTLELHHLRTLRAIADAGSMSRAAVALGCSQSAVSRQLQRIEEYVGEQLFRRSASGVEPTPYGAELLVRAGDVLARADELTRRPADGPGGRLGPVRLAATNTPVLPGLVLRLRSRMPALGLRLRSVYSSARLVELMEHGELDAAVAADYPGQELPRDDRVMLRPIVTEPSFLALSARHRLRHRREIALAELSDEAWFLTPDDGAGWPGVFYTACREAGFRPASVHEFPGDSLQVQHLIAEGLGVAAIQATRHPVPGVLIKPLAGAPLRCRYVLLWHRDRVEAELAAVLFAAASGAYRDLVARAPHLRPWATWC